MRLLQIGMGGWGRNWAATVVPAVPEVKPVGYVDTAAASLREVVDSGLASEALCFSSLDDAMTATSPDAVLVTANLAGHFPAAVTALRAGLHVLVEKPLAPSMEDARTIVDLADKSGLTVMVSQNYRFHPAVRAVRNIVHDRTLGSLNAISVDFRRAGKKRTPSPGRPALTDPLLGDMSIHHFDLMRAITGSDAREVVCRTWHPAGYGYGGPPAGAALITLDGGLVVSYRGSWVSPGATTAWAGEWRMEFDRGEVWWTSRPDGSEQGVVDSVRIRSTSGEERPLPLPALARTDRAGCLTEFEASVREGRTPETAAHDNLGSLAITYAAIESARTGGLAAVG
jgi:predicted dehydrogenase